VHADWRCSADPASSTPDVGDGDFRLVFDQVNPATEPGAVYRVAPTAEGGSITQAKAGNTILGIETTSDPDARLTCAPFRASFFSGDFEDAFALADAAPTIVAPGTTLTVPVTITNPSRSEVRTAIAVDFSSSATPATPEVSAPSFRPLDGQMSDNDDSVWQIDILWPGESASIEIDYVVGTDTPGGTTIETRVDGVDALDRAGVEPIATDGISHAVSVPVGNAQLTLQNSGILNDDDGTAGVSAGDTISYSFTISNDSDVALTGIEVDSAEAAISGGPIASMAPGAVDSSTFSGQYTLTQADIDSGFFLSTASVSSAEGALAEDSDMQTFTGTAAISVNASGALVDRDASGGPSAGDDIAYTFAVENLGTLTLTNVTVTDADPDLTVVGGPIASLGPDEIDEQTISGTYAITQADIDSGSYGSTASVSSDQGAADSDQHVQTLAGVPAVALVKTGSLNDDDDTPGLSAGDTISYTFEIENTGNVTLTNLAVSDPGAMIAGGPIASLAPGAVDSATISGSYVVTQADIDAGSYENTATVEADGDATAQGSDTLALNGSPQMTLTLSPSLVDVDQSSGASAGDQIVYAFTLTNGGNVTLNNLSVAASDSAVAVGGGPIASLAPGTSDSTSISATYTVTQADVDNGSYSVDFDAVSDEASDLDNTIFYPL
jgi:uncharacterized repeat protein (TIGR01451 family)